MPLDNCNPLDGENVQDASHDAALFVFQIMPRNMYFGAARATSIDLCVRDLVAFSRFRASTHIFAEPAADSFQGFRLRPLPSPSLGATWRRAVCVAKAAQSERPAIIVVQQHLPTAAAIAKRLKWAKVVLHTHNFQKSYRASKSLSGAIRAAFKSGRYTRLAGLIHVSRACETAFRRSWPSVNVPSCVVNNGLDFEVWRPAVERAPEILCVGRCAPEKGILEAALGIASVLPRFPDWRTRFILSDINVHPDYFRQTAKVLSRLGGRSVLLTQRPFDEIKAATERAAIAVVPSKWAEPFGRTALEAHAGGAALISSGTGGLAEISGEGAFILPAVTAEAIGNAAERLIRETELRSSLAEAGARRVRALFDIRAQAARLDAFYAAMMRPRAETHGPADLIPAEPR